MLLPPSTNQRYLCIVSLFFITLNFFSSILTLDGLFSHDRYIPFRLQRMGTTWVIHWKVWCSSWRYRQALAWWRVLIFVTNKYVLVHCTLHYSQKKSIIWPSWMHCSTTTGQDWLWHGGYQDIDIFQGKDQKRYGHGNEVHIWIQMVQVILVYAFIHFCSMFKNYQNA